MVEKVMVVKELVIRGGGDDIDGRQVRIEKKGKGRERGAMVKEGRQ